LRSRSFIRVQNGCEGHCSYCIVPQVRPQERSFAPDDIIARINHKAAAGYKEVVLTGTEVGAYRYENIGLAGLLERILAQTDIPRLRLSSLQPNKITPELLSLWQNPWLCSHFHLSLQSGSDAVLRRMRRRYNTKGYSEAVSLIRSMVPGVAITTDVIVGFPGETDKEFEQSYELCKLTGFARMHVFPYSSRPGTEAAQMPDKVNAAVKRERLQKMLALADESAAAFRQQYIGRQMQVLWEQQAGGIWSGLTGNYIRVYSKDSRDLTNRITKTKLEKLYRDGVWGSLF
jgi:threonylcarbamoyladenosine tRNA methylthiotransferase MtaB